MSTGSKLYERTDHVSIKVSEAFDNIKVYADRHLEGLKKQLARQEPYFMS